LNLSLATFVSINAYSKLSLGLQGSFAQRKIDYSRLSFSNQFTGTGYDPSISNGESTMPQVFMYPDLAAGLNWSFATKDNLVSENRQRKANMGIAFYHLNQPKQFYLAGSSPKLNMKYILHGDFLFGIPGKNIAIAPSFLFQFQGPNKELTTGTLIKYYIKEDSKYTGIIQRTSVNVGLFYRYQDAVVFVFSYDKKQQYSIGFSYDLNVSGLSKASRFIGGPEITFKYNTANAYLYQKKIKQE
jgi:type IX secretion system PorP/SprF family membrane protein